MINTDISALVEHAYDNDYSCEECVALLESKGFKGFTWERIADMYEEIYCVEEGK